MGSPVFVSVLAGMSLLMGATLALQPLLLARRWSIPLLILALGYLGYAVTAAGGRSALVGTFLTLGVLWLLVIFRATLWPKRTPELRFPALVATGILVAALLGGFIGVQEGRGARNFAALIDVLSSEELTESSTLSRTLFYRAALPALLAQPVRPYGVNSFLEVIWAYADEDVTERLLDIYQYVPEEARATAFVDRSAWVYQDPDEGRWVGVGTGHDKVHNYILDVWLAFGLVPLLALVALLALAFFSMLRSREPLALGAAAAMAVYAIYAQAWFPAPATDPLLFILFGVGWGALERSRRADELEEQERSASRRSRAEWRRLQRAKG
jgi:O-antigen ligase